ncbi:MAG: hypothetical protein AAB807_00150 [Patescibacteria group bacterium]
MRFESSSPIKKGAEYELALLGGKPDLKPETPPEIKKHLFSDFNCPEETNELMLDIEKYSQSDPINPKKWFLKELRHQIINALNLKTKEEQENIKIFSTVGTTLDTRRGIDFFIGYYDAEKKKTIRIAGDVTEATLAEKIKRSESATFNKIFIFGDVGEKCLKGDEKECFEIMSHYGFQFAEAIKAKIARIRPA